MVQLIADRRDVDFVLHEQLEVEKLSKHPAFSEFNRKTIDLVISEARNLAIKEMLPVLKLGDEQGASFEKGQVKVPESFHAIYRLFREGEWIALSDAPEWGGQGMPLSVALAAKAYFNGANFPFMMCMLLSHGAGKLVETFGTEKQKKLFLKKMYNGTWGGTMMLTEPEAGSDVGALTTSAVKNEDGTYSLSGSKIFITYGDHDFVENIIHLVLARIEGAPAGTAGISLFAVPKIWVNDDGTLGEFNDVVCTGIEEKMGIHASPTCSMTLGGKGQCRGLLIGEPNKGMREMFIMMNEARMDVGIQGFGCASASFMNALNYARQRVQGRHLEAKGKDAPGVPIIQHPDVRRMLLTMKAFTEAIRSAIYFTGFCEDMIHIADNGDEKARYQGLIDFLIPIVKGYSTDRAFEICSMGVQVYGGYGYTKEFPQEQLLRDTKITQIYEGANGIQAMDLLGRKLGLNSGKALTDILAEMKKTLDAAKGIGGLEKIASKFEDVLGKYQAACSYMLETARSEKMMYAYANAYTFMEVTGDTIMAWMLLWRATIAARKLENGGRKNDTAFYEGVIMSARFFISSLLPVTIGKMNSIYENDGSVIDISEESFGGK